MKRIETYPLLVKLAALSSFRLFANRFNTSSTFFLPPVPPPLGLTLRFCSLKFMYSLIRLSIWVGEIDAGGGSFPVADAAATVVAGKGTGERDGIWSNEFDMKRGDNLPTPIELFSSRRLFMSLLKPLLRLLMLLKL